MEEFISIKQLLGLFWKNIGLFIVKAFEKSVFLQRKGEGKPFSSSFSSPKFFSP